MPLAARRRGALASGRTEFDHFLAPVDLALLNGFPAPSLRRSTRLENDLGGSEAKGTGLLAVGDFAVLHGGLAGALCHSSVVGCNAHYLTMLVLGSRFVELLFWLASLAKIMRALLRVGLGQRFTSAVSWRIFDI